jgi:hypothetical protein
LPDYVNAAWLGYLMERQTYIREHADQYRLTTGIAIPRFGEEVEARKTMAQIWKELKEKDQSRKDTYLDQVISVYEADFMREYVWTYLRQQSWTRTLSISGSRSSPSGESDISRGTKRRHTGTSGLPRDLPKQSNSGLHSVPINRS